VVRGADDREVEDVGVGRRVAGPDLDAEQPGDQRREDRHHEEEDEDRETQHRDLVRAEPTDGDLDR
jgi:hypothetical protein